MDFTKLLPEMLKFCDPEVDEFKNLINSFLSPVTSVVIFSFNSFYVKLL